MVLWKKLWDHAKNYEKLVYSRKNYDTIKKNYGTTVNYN